MPTCGLNCKTCHYRIGMRQHQLKCANCGQPHHRTCHPLVKTLPIGYKISNVKPDWICPNCDDSTVTPPSIFQSIDVDAIIQTYQADTSPQLLGTKRIIPIPRFAKGQLLGHLNCNSLIGKIDEIRNFLMTNPFVFCGITETKLDDFYPSSEYNVDGYNLLRFDRQTRGGGGSIIYLNNDTRYLPLHYDVQFPTETEVNIIQLFPQHTKPIIVILIYCPPHVNKLQFVDSLELLLTLVSRDKTDFMVLGDVNIDLLVDSLDNRRISNVTSSVGLSK